MKRLYNMTQADRWKLILLLSAILVIIITTGMVERYKLDRIHSGFSSIYSDRLIPATDIYYISDHLYEKRFLLDEFLAENPCLPGFEKRFHKRNAAIDSLLRGYEKTYLVKEESKYLLHLKKDLADYGQIEERVVNLTVDGFKVEAKNLFEGKGREEFNDIIQNLHHLASIQSTVGKELIMKSNADFASTNLLSYLRYSVSMIIGLAIMVLVQASRVVRQPHQKFNLN